MYEETLYKTANPQLNKSEYYELSIKRIPGLMGERVWAFREFHGWWDDEEGKPKHPRKTIDTEAEGITEVEALEMLNKAKAHLVKNGFVHSFTPNQFDNSKYEYRQLSIE